MAKVSSAHLIVHSLKTVEAFGVEMFWEKVMVCAVYNCGFATFPLCLRKRSRVCHVSHGDTGEPVKDAACPHHTFPLDFKWQHISIQSLWGLDPFLAVHQCRCSWHLGTPVLWLRRRIWSPGHHRRGTKRNIHFKHHTGEEKVQHCEDLVILVLR